MTAPKAQPAISERELEPIIEQLAVKIHEAWMQERRAQGWTYGEQRDDIRKQHPCLVDYTRLPESEKELDLRSARTAIRGLVDVGYAIVRAEPIASGVATPLCKEIRRQLLSAEQSLGLAELCLVWHQCRSVSECSPDLHLKLGELILKRGEPILAYDVLSRGLAHFENTPSQSPDDGKLVLRLRQLLCLALAQSGAAERARKRLEKLFADGHDNPETLGLLGRVHKDLAFRSSTEDDRLAHLGEAFKVYRQGFEKADAAYRQDGKQFDAEDAYYCGINAAAIAMLRGESQVAQDVAGRVREICEVLLQRTPGNYWLLGTLGEAELICARFDQARRWYRAAVDNARDNWREISSTRRQLRLLAPHVGQAAKEWDSIFPSSAVVVFASPRWQLEETIPAGWLSAMRQELELRMSGCRIIAGYVSAISPADLLAGEALLKHGAEVHIVLPFSENRAPNFFRRSRTGASGLTNCLHKQVRSSPTPNAVVLMTK